MEVAGCEPDELVGGRRDDHTGGLGRQPRRFVTSITGVRPSSARESDRQTALPASLLGSVGADGRVEPPVNVDYGYNIQSSDGFIANVGCVFFGGAQLSFGTNCLLGLGAHVYAADRAAGLGRADPVTVGDDVWVGDRAVPAPGVTVGDRAVVEAGSVVVNDVPVDTLVSGNPAERIRGLD